MMTPSPTHDSEDWLLEIEKQIRWILDTRHTVPVDQSYTDTYAPRIARWVAAHYLKPEGVETLESVFMGLPNGCVLKTPNNYSRDYTCVYRQNSRNPIKASGKTPKEAVIKLAEKLAVNHEA